MPNGGEVIAGWMAVALAAAVATAVLAALVRAVALRSGMLDHPGARSSHRQVTPTGGGIAIAVVVITGLVVCATSFAAARGELVATAIVATVIALLGLLDDRRPIAARYRLTVQLLAIAAWLAVLPVWPEPAALGIFGNGSPFIFVLLVLAATWSVNLYNFMDGIDGIAAVQAVTVFGTAAALLAGDGGAWTWSLSIWAGSAAGFLLLNRPPAKLFMGDCGSALLGFLVAAAAFVTVAQGRMSVAVWLILMACFFADTAVTLLTRALRGERLAEGHRSHAYQILARRWQSHGRVTLLVGGVNLAWLSPLAWLAGSNPDSAVVIAVIAYMPVVGGVLWLGAGRASTWDAKK